MEMKYYESDDYQEILKVDVNTLRKSVDLLDVGKMKVEQERARVWRDIERVIGLRIPIKLEKAPTKNTMAALTAFVDTVEKKQERAKLLRDIERATGLSFAVVTDKGPANDHMAACIDTRTYKTFITEEMLHPDNRTFAFYAAYHELEHYNNKFFHINMKEHLSEDEIDVVDDSIEKSLNLPHLLDIDWVEGFNDLITAERRGENDNSGYKEDVTAAEELERLALKELGVSLKEPFRMGNETLFFERLEALGHKLLLKRAIQKAFDAKRATIEKAHLDSQPIQEEVLKRLENLSVDFETLDEWTNAAEKILDEMAQIVLIRNLLGQPAVNQNTWLVAA